MRLGAALLAGAILLAGCAAQTPPAQVTRFHLGQPIAPGEISIEPRDQAQGASLEFDSYAGSVARELKAQGFTIAPSLTKSELVANVEVTRQTRATGPARSPFSIGIGGGTGGGYGGGVGVGGGVSFPIGKATAPEATGTQLFVQLKRRSDSSVIWEGRAQLEARNGTPYAAPAAAVDKLAAALFKGFPGESGRTISVK
jgi:hypothetical protein